MITEWKRCAKLIKYGYNLKSSLAGAAIFFVWGIVMCVGTTDMFSMGGMYMVLGPMFMIQCIYTSLSAGLSLSSPRRRFIETWFHDGLQLLIGLLGYALVILIAIIKITSTHYAAEEITVYGQAILFTGMITGVLMIYMGIVYKTFLFGIILFTGSFAFIYAGLSNGMFNGMFGALQSVTMVNGTLFGLLFIAIGAIISGILRRVLYRKPFSKYSIRTNFGK